MQKVSIRDLINIGIFTVAYFFVIFASGMLGLLGPLFLFVGWGLGILVNGTVCILLLARVPKMGAMTILGFFIGGIMSITQSPYAIFGTLGFGVIADLVQSKAGKARSFGSGRARLAYGIFSLWYGVPMLPILLDRASYLASRAEKLGTAYMQTFDAIFQPWVVVLWIGGVFLLGLIGAQIGISVNRRHFQRAGVSGVENSNSK